MLTSVKKNAKSHLAQERNLNLHRLDTRNPAQLLDLWIQKGDEFPTLLIQSRDLMIRVAGTPERRHELLLHVRHGSVVTTVICTGSMISPTRNLGMPWRYAITRL
jgi:hypothetical protein